MPRPNTAVLLAGLVALLLLASGGCAASRQLLQQDGAPCCEDCPNEPDNEAVFLCFRDCQDCVSGEQCIELTQDVGGRVADVACEYAAEQCGIGLALAKAQFQVPREECYKASKNVCTTYADQYAESGQGSCTYWSEGGGNCDAGQFQSYVTQRIDEICEQVAQGVAIALP